MATFILTLSPPRLLRASTVCHVSQIWPFFHMPRASCPAHTHLSPSLDTSAAPRIGGLTLSNLPGHQLGSSSAKKPPGAPHCLQVGVILNILNLQSVLGSWALTFCFLNHEAVQGAWMRVRGAFEGSGQFFQKYF